MNNVTYKGNAMDYIEKELDMMPQLTTLLVSYSRTLTTTLWIPGGSQLNVLTETEIFPPDNNF